MGVDTTYRLPAIELDAVSGVRFVVSAFSGPRVLYHCGLSVSAITEQGFELLPK